MSKAIDWCAFVLLVTLLFAFACGSGGVALGALAPSITTEPVAQNTRVGQMATFAVTASGTTPLRYQWSHRFVLHHASRNASG